MHESASLVECWPCWPGSRKTLRREAVVAHWIAYELLLLLLAGSVAAVLKIDDSACCVVYYLVFFFL